jgi:aerobic carbon-monoxide dehydrogenase medium subunit
MIHPFEYLAPKKLKDALKLIDEHAEDYKIICGGQSLLVLMRQGLVAPAVVIDIKGISELDYIKNDAKEGMRIGTITTHRNIEKSAVIKKNFPSFAQMELRLASIQTRNRGSIGGNVCHGDPAADPPSVLMALGASIKLSSVKGERIVKLDDFYVDYFETVLGHGEMLTEIQIPPSPPYTGTAYQKFNIISCDMATVGIGVSITLSGKDGICKDCRISMGNVAPTVRRAHKAEEVLKGNKITDKLLVKAGEVASTETDPISDINATADYRHELVKIMVKRMAAEAINRANKA